MSHYTLCHEREMNPNRFFSLSPDPPTRDFSIGNHVSRTHETRIFMSNSVKFGQVLGSVLNNSKNRTVTILDPLQGESQMASKTSRLKLK